MDIEWTDWGGRLVKVQRTDRRRRERSEESRDWRSLCGGRESPVLLDSPLVDT